MNTLKITKVDEVLNKSVQKIDISKIYLIIKTVNSNSIITEIEAFDKSCNLIFGHSNPDGIGDNETALRINKLLLRSNSAFENIDLKPKNDGSKQYWYSR